MKKSFQKLPVQKKKQGSQFYLLFSCLLSTFKDFQFLPFLKKKKKVLLIGAHKPLNCVSLRSVRGRGTVCQCVVGQSWRQFAELDSPGDTGN